MVKYFVWWEIIRRESKYNFTTSFPQSGTFISLSQNTCQTRKCIKLAAILIIKEKSAWVSDYCDGQRSSVCKLSQFSSFWDRVWFLVSVTRSRLPGLSLGTQSRERWSGRSGERGALTVNTSPGWLSLLSTAGGQISRAERGEGGGHSTCGTSNSLLRVNHEDDIYDTVLS